MGSHAVLTRLNIDEYLMSSGNFAAQPYLHNNGTTGANAQPIQYMYKYELKVLQQMVIRWLQ